jgi:quercetin dioxygenase-like cupin family protein
MEFFTESDYTPLRNPGVTSLQIVSPHNSESARVTITRVTMEPGATQPRHCHQSSEQIWVALEGAGMLLLGDGATRSFKAGEAARFAEGDIHGFENIGSEPFVYLSVTSPPVKFDYAYKEKGSVPSS